MAIARRSRPPYAHTLFILTPQTKVMEEEFMDETKNGMAGAQPVPEGKSCLGTIIQA